ncbi:MAG TPA: hypothetical protein VE131_02460, partial [Terriglobales bacterium]|nr:hypothetical protein [Terriglobales bacterium]
MLKLLGFVTFTVVLLVLVSGLAFYHLVRVGEFRRFLIRELEQKTDLKVQLGEANFEFGRRLGIVFNQITLSEP